MSAPSSGTRNFHMIEAVPARLEGAPGGSGDVGRMNSTNMLLYRRRNQVPVFQRSHIALEFIHRSHLAGVEMLGSGSESTAHLVSGLLIQNRSKVRNPL